VIRIREVFARLIAAFIVGWYFRQTDTVAVIGKEIA